MRLYSKSSQRKLSQSCDGEREPADLIDITKDKVIFDEIQQKMIKLSGRIPISNQNVERELKYVYCKSNRNLYCELL